MATEHEIREKRQRQMGELAELAYDNDPQAKAALDAFAETQMPGVRAQVAADKKVRELEQRFDAKSREFDLKVAAEKAARAREASLERLKAHPELRISDADVPELEKHMLERGIGNYEDGAYSWRRMHQIAAPTQARSYTMEVPGLDQETGPAWLKGVIRPGYGVDKELLDRRAKGEAARIMHAFDTNRAAAEREYGG